MGKNITVLLLCNALVNIALIAAATIVAMHFGKPVIFIVGAIFAMLHSISVVEKKQERRNEEPDEI